MGAAEAIIAAVFVAAKLKRRRDAFVTFGSSYPGLFKKVLQSLVGCDRTIRMDEKDDLFTDVPMTVPGYTHVCSGTQVDGRTGLSYIQAHILYLGYERGIKNKYSNISEINFGSGRMLI